MMHRKNDDLTSRELLARIGLGDEPVVSNEWETGSTYFHEPLDLVLGLIPDWGPARGELLTLTTGSCATASARATYSPPCGN